MSRKGENIYKRKDGRWEGRYIKGYDLNHKAQYGYVYAHTYTDAKCKLTEVKLIPTIQQRKTKNTRELEKFCITWLQKIKTQVKQSTYAKYHNLINNHIIPSLGKMSAINITPITVRQFIDEKLSKGKIHGNGGLSPKTVKDIISVLKLVLQYANSIDTECYYNLDTIKIKSHNKNVSVFTENERTSFTAYLMNDIDNTKLGILISLYAGLRIGEICALKFEDISDGIIHVRHTMQRIQNFDGNDKKTKVIITEPKSSCSVRDVPIPDFLNKLIKQFYISKAYVLTGESKKYVEPRTLQNRFKTHTNNCGLHGVNYHITRHTYASMCVEHGFEIKSLSEMLGHSSVNITLNRYVHSSMDLKKQNVAKLNNLPS